MVCTASDLLGWKDFPKGLKVLLLDTNWNSASEMKTKLQEMDYSVTIFSSEDEALLAISSRIENFHVAIVEVNTDNSSRRLKFLENAKEIPTIMISDIHCLTTMMNCIALGAVEFLKKPLSEEKLKNIWQHVVHKAYNAGGNVSPKLLKPIKESMVSESLELKKTDTEMDDQISVEQESSSSKSQESEQDQLSNSDKFPAPSTPQIKQGERFLDDGDYHDQPNSSTDKENGEQDGECSKSVDTTCGNSVTKVKAMPPTSPQRSVDGKVNKDTDNHHCLHDSEEVDNLSHKPENEAGSTGITAATLKPRKETISSNTGGSKTISNRKKAKVDWTPDLHKKFVQAVEQLGIDHAIPSRILELMKVEGLTRHNVASHLQKYRMQRRHILPKEDQRRWPQPKASSLQRSCYYPPHRPVMAFPPYHHSNQAYPAGAVYPMWPGTPTTQHQNVQMWGPPGSSWNPMENWLWKPFPTAVLHADAWGCPVLPSPQFPPSAIPEGARGLHSPKSYGIPRNSTECEVADGVIDKMVKEAISKPWLPLPIGLKPPSTDSVLAELSRKGISAVPPRFSINGDHSK